VPWLCLSKVFLPFHLTVIYPKWDIDASRWTSFLPGVILVGCFGLFWWKRETWGRGLLFASGYFVVMLFPVLGFFDQGIYSYSLVWDHWQYYAIVGPIALVIAAGEFTCRRFGNRGRYWGTVASLALLVVLGVGSWRRNCVYANNYTLWKDNVTKNPNAWLAHYNLGNILGRAGKNPEAIAQYEQALRINPNVAEAHYNLGLTLEQLGRGRDAIAQYNETLRLEPRFTPAKENLARLRATE
jgi:tetratricopeptide (TPR) repeat protein